MGTVSDAPGEHDDQDTGDPGDPGDAAGDTGGEADERRERRFEVMAAILLAVAALSAAWGGYQASLWDGIQSSNYSRAGALRARGNLDASEANQNRIADLTVVENFVDATFGGDEALSNFYRERARPELKPALNDWLDTRPLTNRNAPASPLSMPSYTVARDDDAHAASLTRQAEAAFAAGERANDISDRYTLATLLLALVLFFAAISERFRVVPARAGLLILGYIGLVVGILVMLSQPVTSG
jgi:hypothetical protein